MNQNFVSIHPGARIGKNVKIDPFTMIHDDVVIGDNSWIGSSVSIFPGARIGNNCKIFPVPLFPQYRRILNSQAR